MAANGEELSERYLAHAEFVALTVLSRESSREPVEPDLAGLDSGHIAAELEAIRTLYGPVMKHDWGWIAELAWPLHPEQKRFEKFRPSFFDVVKLAGMKERYDSDYGLTSDFSHASSLGTLFSMGQTPAGRGSADIPLVGMSGLDQAGGGASQSFAFIATSLLMSAFEEEAGTASGEQEAKAVFEAPIRAFALQELAKDAAMAFTQVAENLRRHPELLEDA